MSRKQPLPESRTIGRALGITTVILLGVACASPAAEQSQAASASPTSPSAPTVRATPTTPSLTFEPTAAAASTIGYEAPDGFLPPNSIVQVVVDRLQLRDEPGLAGPVEGFATKGDRFSVAGWFGPVRRDGLDWYRLGPAIGGDLDAWAAAGSGADTYLEVVQLECPDVDSDLSVLISMNEWDGLSCFGGRSLTLEGTFSCGVCDGTMPGDFAPAWLAHPLFGHFLWADFQAGEGPLRAYIPPDSGIEMATFGSIVRATGHFSDPVSTTCTMSTFDGERAAAVDQRTAELYCRERFVLESLEVIGTDPNYRDPYNP